MCATDLEDSTLIDAGQLARICTATSQQSVHARLKTKLHVLLPFLSHIAEGSGRPHAELLSLLQSFRTWKATDPRDKVYALLGISSDGSEAKSLEPDYNLSLETVYQRVAVYMIDRYQSLEILSFILPTIFDHDARRRSSFPELMRKFRPPKPPVLRLPSWCPDWRVAAAISSPATVRSSRSTPEPNPSLSLPDDDNMLSVRGTCIGVIGSIFPNGVDFKFESTSMLDVPGRVLTALSVQLARLASGFTAAFGVDISAGDHICILEHTTGITILRRLHDGYSLLLSKHGQYSQIAESTDERLRFDATPSCEDLDRLMMDLYFEKYQRRPAKRSFQTVSFVII